MPSAGSSDYLIAATVSAISPIEVDRFPSIRMLRFGKPGKVTTVLLRQPFTYREKTIQNSLSATDGRGFFTDFRSMSTCSRMGLLAGHSDKIEHQLDAQALPRDLPKLQGALTASTTDRRWIQPSGNSIFVSTVVIAPLQKTKVDRTFPRQHFAEPEYRRLFAHYSSLSHALPPNQQGRDPNIQLGRYLS